MAIVFLTSAATAMAVLVGVLWATKADTKDAVEHCEDHWRSEVCDLRLAHKRDLGTLKEQHDTELYSLRKRCAEYAESRLKSDLAAGFDSPDWLTIGMAIECVPLRVAKEQ